MLVEILMSLFYAKIKGGSKYNEFMKEYLKLLSQYP